MKKLKTTSRGFNFREFTDRSGIKCSIQKSSLADEDAIWLGADEIGLKEFVAYRQPNAWEDVNLEQTQSHHYVANNQMHLTRQQVKKLLPILTYFVEAGDLA
jgi:hypothetical protein